jgi:hypothetical protein
MALNLIDNEVPEVPFVNEVAFIYKKELYKVHVNVLVEKDETVYKLYFKNTIEHSDKSLMKLVRENNLEGSFNWACKTDYFSYLDNEIAAVAGAAIDIILQKEKKC